MPCYQNPATAGGSGGGLRGGSDDERALQEIDRDINRIWRELQELDRDLPPLKKPPPVPSQQPPTSAPSYIHPQATPTTSSFSPRYGHYQA